MLCLYPLLTEHTVLLSFLLVHYLLIFIHILLTFFNNPINFPLTKLIES